jgi:hypothetical protein
MTRHAAAVGAYQLLLYGLVGYAHFLAAFLNAIGVRAHGKNRRILLVPAEPAWCAARPACVPDSQSEF